jgi:sugar phosphate permease
MQRPSNDDRNAARRAWVLSWIAYATYYTGRKGFGVAKKSIERDLGIGREGLAAIDTGHLVFYALGQFANGIAADRIGARRLIGYGMLASAAACAAFGASSSALALLVAFSFNGYAQSTGWPGTTRAMAEWTDDSNRRRVMALWCTCYQVGGIAASAGAAWLLRFGWRSAFYGPAVLIAVVAVVILFGLPSGAGSLAGSEHASEDDRRARSAAMRAALSSPTLWCFGASYFAIKLIRYSLLFWLPYYLSDDLAYSPSAAGYLSMAFEVGGILSVVGTGLFTHRSRGVSRPALSAGMLVALAAMIFLYTKLAPLGVVANALGLALIGFCLFGPDSLLSGAVAQDAGGPHAAATATGLVNGVGSLGAILQGALNAWVSRAYGWHAVFVSFVTFSIIAALALVPTIARDTKPTGTSI